MDDEKLRPFPVEVIVNGVRVRVTLMLRTLAEPQVSVKVSTPEQPDDAARDSDLLGRSCVLSNAACRQRRSRSPGRMDRQLRGLSETRQQFGEYICPALT